MDNKKTDKWSMIDAWLQRIAWFFSIVTSVFIAVFTWQQVEINEKLGQDEHMLQQPVFQVQKVITKSEGSEAYDHEDIEVYNHGEMAKDIESVHLYTYLRFVYTPDIMKQYCDTFYVPVYYYGAKYTTYNLTGLVAYTQTTELNLKSYVRIYWETLHSSEYPTVVDLEKVTIVSVNYVDKLDKSHTVSFMNGESVSASQVASIAKRSMEISNNRIWDIYDLSYEKLKEICHCE